MIATSPVFALSILIPTLIVLTSLFIFFEVKKKTRYQTARIIAIALLMASLAGIMLRPKFRSTNIDSVLLLTQGYTQVQVDSILAKHPNISVMRQPDVRPFKKATILSDYEMTRQKIDFVAGEGLKLYHLDRLGDATFAYTPSRAPEGLVSLNLEARYELHRSGTISASYNNNVGTTSISLYGPAGTEDSLTIYKKGKNDFSLSIEPRQSGSFTYTLVVRDSLKTTKESVPIHVNDSRKLGVLFLQNYPTFETQYLKTYLAEKDHKMIVRSQLSENSFRHEFVNRESVPVSRLSEQLLDGIDLVVADANSLSRLTSQERNNLIRAVQRGLGLLTLTRGQKNQTFYFPFETISVKKDTTSINLHHKQFILSTLPIRVNKKQSIIPLMSNGSGILNGYTFQGAGKIGFQLLQETYQLRLAGDSLAYADIWSPLLEKLARRTVENSSIKIVTPFPWYEDEPIEVEVLSAYENIILIDDSTSIPLREDLGVDNVWHGRTWGGNKGWHVLTTNHGAVKPYYIQSRPAWQALSITHQMSANRLREKKWEDSSQREITTMRDVPQIIFYLTLIMAAGYVWLAPKL